MRHVGLLLAVAIGVFLNAIFHTFSCELDLVFLGMLLEMFFLYDDNRVNQSIIVIRQDQCLESG